MSGEFIKETYWPGREARRRMVFGRKLRDTKRVVGKQERRAERKKERQNRKAGRS